MTKTNPYFSSNSLLKYDYVFGLRSLGLILYGILPSSLLALGIFKVNIIEIRQYNFLIPLSILALAPLIVLYLLIRKRMYAWYLMSDGLWIRSILLTSLIFVFSVVVSLAGGVITKKYILVDLKQWLTLDPQMQFTPIVESIMVAIAALVGSSTLFLSSIKEESGLPGLPSDDFVKDIRLLRTNLKKIQNNPIWNHTDENDLTGLLEIINNSREILLRLSYNNDSNSWNKKFFERLENDLTFLCKAVKQVPVAPSKWIDYFDLNSHTVLNIEEKKSRAAIHNIKLIRIDG